MSKRAPQKISPEALFKFLIVSQVEGYRLRGRTLAEAVRLVAGGRHVDPQGEPRKVRRRTIYRWYAAFKKDGIAGLEPARREPLRGSVVLKDEFIQFIESEKKEDRDASIPELIRRARAQGILGPDEQVCRTTVWRVCQRLGIETRPRKQPKDGDSRRFAFVKRMQMVLVDFKHFRAGATRARRCALYFLDDATRFGLAVLVCTSENTEAFLRALHDLLCRFGWMDAIYSDNGPAFISEDTTRVMANLELCHIKGTPGYPEGHGKIERFNRSVKARLLRSLDGSPDVDPSPGALSLRLSHDLFEVYNHLPHSKLDNETPYQRWHSCKRDLQPVASDAWLRSCFTLTEERRVSNDNVVSYAGTEYEVPRGHAGEKIDIYRRLLENDDLYVLHDEKHVQLQPVDLASNAYSPRSKSIQEQDETPVAAKTASTLSFEALFSPVLDREGGCPKSTDPDDDEEE